MSNNEAIVRNFLQQVWNEKDINSIPLFLSDAYTVYRDNGDPWEGKTLDHAAFKTRLGHSFDPFPDIHFDIQSTIADGDAVAVQWIMTGTNSGPVGYYPATYKKIKANGITIYHLREGKLCGHTQVYDRTTIMKQLGFI